MCSTHTTIPTVFLLLLYLSSCLFVLLNSIRLLHSCLSSLSYRLITIENEWCAFPALTNGSPLGCVVIHLILFCSQQHWSGFGFVSREYYWCIYSLHASHTHKNAVMVSYPSLYTKQSRRILLRYIILIYMKTIYPFTTISNTNDFKLTNEMIFKLIIFTLFVISYFYNFILLKFAYYYYLFVLILFLRKYYLFKFIVIYSTRLQLLRRIKVYIIILLVPIDCKGVDLFRRHRSFVFAIIKHYIMYAR